MEKNLSIVRVDTRHYRTIARENWGLTKDQMKGKHVHHRIKRCEGGTDDPSNLYVCSEWFHDNVWHAGEGGFTGCASLGAKKLHENKDENGKSIVAMKMLEVIHSEKDEKGRSLTAMRNINKLNEEKDKSGRSVQGVKNAERLHSNRDAFGRSVVAMRMLKKIHENKDEFGRSIMAVNNAKRLNAEKDEFGRSINAMKSIQRWNSEKDEKGRSVNSVKNAEKLNKQKWEDPFHPELGAHSPGTLVLMQKRRGYPHGKENRKRVG
jgi:hypothetical protein